GRASANDRCGHGRCEDLGPRPDGGNGCSVSAGAGADVRYFAVILVLFLTACGRPVPEGVTELVYATPYPPAHPFSRADQRWMDFVNENSEGRLIVRPVWSGALLSSDMSMEELRHGVADIGLITPIYARGGSHLIRIQSGFYSGADSIESQLEVYECRS